MKTIKKIVGLFVITCLTSVAVLAQDDVYFGSSSPNNSSSNEGYDNNGMYYQGVNTPDSTSRFVDSDGDNITNNYYYNNYYDYEYTSRLRRFYDFYDGFGYYSPIYTNYYWYNYNPIYFGLSIYTGYAWWHPTPWGGGYGWNWGWNWGNFGWNNYGWGYPYAGYYGYRHDWMYYRDQYNGLYGNYGLGYGNSYASIPYYNSYDENSNFYGHRGNYGMDMAKKETLHSATATATALKTPINNKGLSDFGKSYEHYVAKNPINKGVSTIKPANHTVVKSNVGMHKDVKIKTTVHSLPSNGVVKNTNHNVIKTTPIGHSNGIKTMPVRNNSHSVLIEKKGTITNSRTNRSVDYSKYTTPSYNYYKPRYNQTNINSNKAMHNSTRMNTGNINGANRHSVRRATTVRRQNNVQRSHYNYSRPSNNRSFNRSTPTFHRSSSTPTFHRSTPAFHRSSTPTFNRSTPTFHRSTNSFHRSSGSFRR